MFNKNLRQIIIFFGLILLVFLYFYLALQHSNLINTKFDDNVHGDQLAHIQAIKKIRQENFRYLGDRNRMPLYDQLQALFYTPGMEDEALFVQAKIVSIVLSIVLLFLIFILSSRYLSLFNNISFTLIAAFTLFLPKAAYIQPELLYYTLAFIVFIFMLRTIKLGRKKDAAMLGILTALSYLTKATALAAFAIFLVFQGGRFLTQIFSTLYKPKRDQPLIIIEAKKIITTSIISLLSFLLVLSPYLRQNKRIYGEYFFNYVTSYYIWYDSWEEFLEDNKAESSEFWLNRPVNETPSFKKYIDEHSLKDAVERIYIGFILQILYILKENYTQLSASFLYIYLLFLIFFAVRFRQNEERLIKYLKNNIFLFLTSYFILQFLAFSWYSILASGPRHTFSLYLPLAFVVFQLIDKFTYPEIRITPKLKVSFLYIFNFFVLIFLLIIFKPFLIPLLLNNWGGR